MICLTTTPERVIPHACQRIRALQAAFSAHPSTSIQSLYRWHFKRSADNLRQGARRRSGGSARTRCVHGSLRRAPSLNSPDDRRLVNQAGRSVRRVHANGVMGVPRLRGRLAALGELHQQGKNPVGCGFDGLGGFFDEGARGCGSACA